MRAADGRAEDEGWVLSVVYDAARDASDLVILDATSFAGPPVATVHLPARVPVRVPRLVGARSNCVTRLGPAECHQLGGRSMGN